jgi:light-regulated signal transduction histidine kinase (bacteriophytochrome)
LRARTAELEAANKESGAFAHSISHDLRAPLRHIDGYSQIVLDQYSQQLPEEGRRFLKIVAESAQHMNQLIEDLLRFSQLGRKPISKQPVNISSLVQKVVEGLRKDQGDRQIDVQIGDLPDCSADPALLKQVFVNLLSNAFKFTRRKKSATIEVGGDLQAGEVVFFVRDNGAGFDMEYADRLFGVFQRFHRADEFEGTGVGLSIVQRIIQRHGGRIWAQAEKNKGATFYFTLPV